MTFTLSRKGGSHVTRRDMLVISAGALASGLAPGNALADREKPTASRRSAI